MTVRRWLKQANPRLARLLTERLGSVWENDLEEIERLRWAADENGPQVGDRVGLGISHPCTTFDKWHWMPIVDADYAVRDAIAIYF